VNDGSDTVDNLLAYGYTWSIYLHGTESAMEYQRMFLVDDRDKEQCHALEYTRELAMTDLLRSAVTRGEFNEFDRHLAVRFSSESKRYPQGMPFSFATETTIKMRVSQCPKDYSEALDRIARLKAENATLSSRLREIQNATALGLVATTAAVILGD
jgi:hypothetical protein